MSLNEVLGVVLTVEAIVSGAVIEDVIEVVLSKELKLNDSVRLGGIVESFKMFWWRASLLKGTKLLTGSASRGGYSDASQANSASMVFFPISVYARLL